MHEFVPSTHQVTPGSSDTVWGLGDTVSLCYFDRWMMVGVDVVFVRMVVKLI